jgi:hypothetical protein
VPGVVKFDGGDIGEVLRLNQNWVMYTPTPPVESGWLSVVGYEATSAAAEGEEDEEAHAVDLLAALRTDVWEWSETAAVEEALSGTPAVPALLYKSSRWEKMVENYLKLVHRPGSERGWGCAAGGVRERSARLGTLARWFCQQWCGKPPFCFHYLMKNRSRLPRQTRDKHLGNWNKKAFLGGRDTHHQSAARLDRVVVGVAYTKNAYSPAAAAAAANPRIDDGWQVRTDKANTCSRHKQTPYYTPHDILSHLTCAALNG